MASWSLWSPRRRWYSYDYGILIPLTISLASFCRYFRREATLNFMLRCKYVLPWDSTPPRGPPRGVMKCITKTPPIRQRRRGYVRTLRQQEELPSLRDHLLRLEPRKPSRPVQRLHGRQLHRRLCRQVRRRWHLDRRLYRGRRGPRRRRTASAGSVARRIAGDRFQRGSLRAAARRRHHPVPAADRGSALEGL